MQRCVAILLALLFGMACVVAPATAQEWPSKPVRIIVPFGAGSTPDVVARLVADGLHSETGQTFIVENKPGASGNTGTDAVAKAAPDGATIGISIGGPLAINTLLFAHLPYDPTKDLTLITMLVTQPSALAVNASLNVNSVPELVELLRKNPGKYNFGSIGVGSLSHLAMEAIALKSGTRALLQVDPV
jgi:tripartite-type tricarboxylate transporter receptor subunit TctC